MDDERHAELHTLATLALAHWNLEGADPHLVKISENTVFRVDSGDASYVLRIHRPGYHTLAELNAELQWTAALNEAGIHAPTAVPTVDGQGYATVALPGSNETRHIGMAEWVEGVLLSDVIKRSDPSEQVPCFERLGRIMAQIHNQAERWPLPATFTRHALDADGFMGDRPFWGRFWEIPQLKPAQRKLVLLARETIFQTLIAYGKTHGTYSLIHADLHADNVVVAGDRLHVIDFDDAGFGWHEYELAVALFHYQGRDNYAAIHDGLIAGYRSERRLDDQSLALLPMFLLVRGLALLGWYQQRPETDRTAEIAGMISYVCMGAEKLKSGKLSIYVR
jgi:Ser/Thr protein kinase RdoA (MazF antagonist)|tara:strand:- start:665 stop:1672 length:1008 start_codon:yes stop_codon:yes gene_type:complete